VRFGDAEMKKVCATFSKAELSYQGLKNMFLLLPDDLQNQQHNPKISFALKILKNDGNLILLSRQNADNQSYRIAFTGVILAMS
jgi:hypothetical protein